MRPGVNSIALAVDDLERAVEFYRDGLGLPTNGIFGTEFAGSNSEPAGAIAMFRIDEGLIMSVYPRSELAKDAHIDPRSTVGSAVSLGHVVDSRHDVQRLLADAERAGATISSRRTALGRVLRLLPRARRTPVGDPPLPAGRTQRRRGPHRLISISGPSRAPAVTCQMEFD